MEVKDKLTLLFLITLLIVNILLVIASFLTLKHNPNMVISISNSALSISYMLIIWIMTDYKSKFKFLYNIISLILYICVVLACISIGIAVHNVYYDELKN